MNKEAAKKIFLEYVSENGYGVGVKILSVSEKKDRFLFEFSMENEDMPIDTPIISIAKKTGVVEELLLISGKDREIIYGE